MRFTVDRPVRARLKCYVLAVVMIGPVHAAWPATVFGQGATTPQPVQTRSPAWTPNWQIEFEAGGVLATSVSAGGVGTFPGPGASFTTSSGGRTTRRVPSWYFGDGSLLLNEALAATPLATRMVPLDSLLGSAGLQGRAAAVFGFRLVRNMTPRYSIEAGMSVGQAAFTLSQSALDQIEISRGSFVTAFQALLGDPSRFTDPVITSDVAFRMGGGYRTDLIGAVRFQLPPAGRVKPYVVAGGGGSFNFGDGPAFTLTGRYTFTAPGFGSRVFDETDQLTVRYRLAAARAVAIAGAGFTYDFGPRHGLVVDGRVHMTPSAFETILEARPSRVTITSPGVISTLGNPSVQISSANINPPLSSLQLNLSEFSSHAGSFASSMVLVARYYIRY